MRHAPQGVRPTEMAGALELRPNTLSNHLSELENAGLIVARRDGRSIFYSADLSRAGALLGYLANDCCRGRPDICNSIRQPTPVGTVFKVLFVCTHNSARSIFAEAILNQIGAGRFHAQSAGTRPAAAPNTQALAVLRQAGLATDGLHTKTLADVAARTPRMDFVFTVCDLAANEDCALWPGQPLTAHWGLPDPVAATGTGAERARAFVTAFEALHRRISAFAALPTDRLGAIALQHRLDAIGLDIFNGETNGNHRP